MAYYWDTSALLSILFQEKRPEAFKHLISKKKGLPGYTSFLTFLEMESAISRRLLEGSLKERDLTEVRLQIQVLENVLAFIWPDAQLLADSKEIILRFGLKPGDALQLASCLLLSRKEKSVTFLCLDQKLNKVAKTYALNTVL